MQPNILKLALIASVAIAAAPAAVAQDAWQQPFADDRATPRGSKPSPQKPVDARPYLAPMNGSVNPPVTAPAGANEANPTDPAPVTMREAVPPPVEKGELAPVMASDGSVLPSELWHGLTVESLEKLIAELTIPPRSVALAEMWRRLMTSQTAPPAGEAEAAKFKLLRAEALYRSGLTAEAGSVFGGETAPFGAIAAVFSARAALASGDGAKACAAAPETAVPDAASLPLPVKKERLLVNGYCAAEAGDAEGAGLAADLLREAGVESGAGLEALYSISSKIPAKITPGQQLTLVEYRLATRAGATIEPRIVETAEPALLAAITNDAKSPAELRLAAAEAAARANVLPVEAVAAVYTALAPKQVADALLAAGAVAGPLQRAALFRALEAETTPMRKTRLIRALIDEARPAGLAFHAMRMASRAANTIKPEPELISFAETAAEIGLASGDLDMTRQWVRVANAGRSSEQSLAHWLALADIADATDANKGEHLGELEALAVRSKFSPGDLHRLATVLDALNYMVPMPLWEAASRTPQPAGGHLPQTGVLSELRDAAKSREFGRTVLLVMKTLGPDGAEGANIIALGDSIRALKRAGFEAEARRLGLEALLGSWPRDAAN